jgi:hypothetical protein
MATVEMAWSGLLNSIQTAINNAGLVPILSADWPNINILQAVVSGSSGPVISLFDRGGIKNVTKAIGMEVATLTTKGTPGAILTPATGTLLTTTPYILTGSGTPFANDTFYINFPSTVGLTNLFAEYIALQGDTLATCLTNFAAAINLIDGLAATVSGNTIHIVNSLTNQFPVQAGVVNIGSTTKEVYRQIREIQITLWTNNVVDRQNYGAVLEQLFVQLEYDYGIKLSDQSLARVMIMDDTVRKDSQLQDIFRRDFIITIDYPVLLTHQVWEVVTTPLHYTPQNP